LDPFATGLLILCVGKETKNAMAYTKMDKVYEATVRLGQTSNTGDPEGEITEVNDIQPNREDIEKVLQKFTGEIKQTPPAHSAIKINGQRAYKLAREGKEVEMPERIITIHSLELVDYTYPELKIRTHVSSGTYIRTLAQDIGESLGTGAYCTQLRRISIGDWSIEQSQSLTALGVTD
jgi:tRNA pseudouridine55 synthase